MQKKPRVSSSKLMAELYPELHQPKPPSRNLRPTEAEMAKALTASRGKYGTAARRLQCSERTLRRYVADSPALQELVSEQRELLIDEAEDTIDAILKNPKYPRQFDAAKFIAERLGRGRGFGHRVEHVNKQEITASAYISIEDSSFNPYGWDIDQHTRFLELMSIPTHELTPENLTEIRELRNAAKIVELSLDEPSAQPRQIVAPAEDQ